MTITRKRILVAVTLVAVLAAGAHFRIDLWGRGAVERIAAPPQSAPASRPANWAQPIASRHLANFHQVAPGIYRSAQPDAEGFAELKSLGVQNLVYLRLTHSDHDLLNETGIRETRIEFDPLHAQDEDVVEFLKFVTNKDNQPLLVHCQFGADRTGTMCAMYRVCVQGWSKDDAIREMTQGNMGYHDQWVNLESYIRHADVQKIKQRAGLP